MLARGLTRLTGGVQAWQRAAVNRQVMAAALTVGAMTCVLKLVVAGRELAVAYRLGTGDSVDAFIIAFLAPSFAINVQIAALAAALMPTFIGVRDREGHEAARRLGESALLAVIVMLAVTSVLLLLLADPLTRALGSGFGAEKLALTRHLFYLLVPVVLLQGLVRFWGTLINASHRFALVAVAPMTTPLVTILAVLLTTRPGAGPLVVGVVGGSALELALVLTLARRLGLLVRPRWHGFDAPTRRVIGQYLPTMLGALTSGASVMVDQSMAAMLAPGSVASLTYGGKLVALVLALSATPISTAILPYLARLAAARDARHLRQTLIGWLGIVLLVSVPLAGLMFQFSTTIVRLFFERGAFDARDTALVSQIQSFYALEIPFYLAGVLGARVLNAMSLNQVTAMVGVMNFTGNIVFNLIFMRWLGLPGIALATSAVYLVSSVVILAVVRLRIRQMGSTPAVPVAVPAGPAPPALRRPRWSAPGGGP